MHHRLRANEPPTSTLPYTPFLYDPSAAHFAVSESQLLREALSQPPWHPGTVRGLLRRVRSGGGGDVSRYEFWLQLPGYDLLCLAARKLARSLTPYYAISLDASDVTRDSAHYMGKLRATSIGGGEWVLFDNGLPARHLGKGVRAAAGHDPHRRARRQLLAVSFRRPRAAESGPARLHAVVPLPRIGALGGGVEGEGARPAQGLPEGEGKLQRYLPREEETAEEEVSAGGSSWLCRLRSRAPDWDPGLRAFTLPFAGRARHSSVKNVQMVDVAAEASRAAATAAAGPAASSPSTVTSSSSSSSSSSAPPPSVTPHRFSMGKLEDDTFSVDFGEPLTPMAAFGLALAICDAKLAFARKLEGVRSASQLLRRQSTRVVPFAHEGRRRRLAWQRCAVPTWLRGLRIRRLRSLRTWRRSSSK